MAKPKNAQFYDFTQQLQGEIFAAAYALRARGDYPPVEAPPALWQLRSGLAESPAWMMVQALEFDPDPVTVDLLRRRAIWSSPGIIRALLELLAAEKWLLRQGDSYRLTDEGREVLHEVRQRGRDLLRLIEPLPAPELQRLDQLLHKVIDACLRANDPPGNWCLAHSRNRAPLPDAPLLSKITQYFSDLNAFRDDCHMAAFRPQQLDAYIFEVFSLMWQGLLQSPAEAYEQLAYRGYSREDFDRAFEVLAARGWVQPLEQHQQRHYALSPQGQARREDIEAQTDAYFYAPWTQLQTREVSELETLLDALQQACRELREGG